MRQRQADMHRQITSEADDMKRRSAPYVCCGVMWRVRCILEELMLVELTRHQKEGEEFRQKMEREKVAFEQSMRSQGPITRTTAHTHTLLTR